MCDAADGGKVLWKVVNIRQAILCSQPAHQGNVNCRYRQQERDLDQ
jgi:hypothetical protein